MGSANGAYRGGVTELRVLIRNSKMYKSWRDLVYQRDRFRCVECGFLGERRTLQCHHTPVEFAEQIQEFIKHYSKYSLPKDTDKLLMLSQCYAPFWKVGNAKTMCTPCHTKLHADERKKLKEQANESKCTV